MSMISEHVRKLRNWWNYDAAVRDQLILKSANIIEMLSEKAKLTSWIPVSEELPTKNGYYLVSLFMPDKISIEEYINGRWYSHYAIYGNTDITHSITAWMPLPEPYREDDVNADKD